MAELSTDEFLGLLKQAPALKKPPEEGLSFEEQLKSARKAEEVGKAQATEKRAKAAEPPPASDLKESAISGLQRGLLSVPGAIGDVTSLAGYVPTLGAKSAIFLREKMGMPFTEQQKADLLKSSELGGKAISAVGPVTTEQLTKAAQPYAEKVFGVGPEYQPQTTSGKIVKEGLGAGVPAALLGPMRGIIPRLVGGVSAGTAGEAAGEYTKGTPYEPYARVGATIAGGLVGQPIAEDIGKIAQGTLRPSAASAERLGETLANYGVEKAAMAQRMATSKDIAEAASNFTPRMREFTQNLLGIKQTGPELAELLERAGATERNRVYGIARQNPSAAAISVPELAEIERRGIFQEASKNALKNAADVPEWDIVPPKVSGGQSQSRVGPGGAQYSVPTPPTATPGNLNYYDQVKQELDSIIEQARRTGDNTRLTAAKKAKTDLLKILDDAVPEYPTARGIAADTFEAASAPQAGARFLSTSNDYNLDQFKKAFSSYSEDQRQAFRVGLMSQLENELANRNTNLIANRFLKNPAFMDKLEFALGKDASAALRGKILSENLVQQAAKIGEQIASREAVEGATRGIGATALKVGIPAGLAGAAFELQPLMFLAQSAGIPILGILAGAGVGTAAAIARFGMNLSERRIANKMVDLIKNNDPKTYSQINQMITDHPAIYQKLFIPLTIAEQNINRDKEKPQPKVPQESIEQAYERLLKEGKIQRPVRASGGRIQSAQSAAEALMKAAESAKKNISKTTEAILDQPDEHVAKALEIAKQHI